MVLEPETFIESRKQRSIGGSIATATPAARTTTTTTRATTTGSGATATTAPAVRDYPDHAMVSMTKDQLKALPAFKYASDAKNR